MQKQILLQNRVVQYSSTGKGTAVVLVHGFGEDSRIWDHQKTLLEKKYHVIVPDLPGTGGSTLPTDEVLSMESMAQDLKAILDAEQIDRCVLLGHSMGGYVTLAFADLFPSYLSGFGLIHSTAAADTETKKEARRKGIDFIKANGAGAFIKTTIPNLFAEEFRQSSPKIVEALIERGQALSAEGLIACYEAMMARPDRTQLLKLAAVPVLIFIGGKDQAVNPDDALQQATLPSVCQVHFIPSIAHMGMYEAPDELHHQVASFLELVETKKMKMLSK